MSRYRTGQVFMGRNLSPQELLRIGVRAAEKRMATKRPSPATFKAGESAAFDAIRIADPQAGTSTHRYRAARYSSGVYRIAHRAATLARRLLWAPSSHLPAWEKRIPRRDPKGRIPASRYYRSGSSYPRYKKPSRKVLDALKVERVTQTLGRNPASDTRGWLVEFKDGMGVHVHENTGRYQAGRFYAMRVHDRVRYYDEARPEPPEALSHAYQYVALTQLVPHQAAFHLMPWSTGGGSHLVADVHDELYPAGVAHDPGRRRFARRQKTRRSAARTRP